MIEEDSFHFKFYNCKSKEALKFSASLVFTFLMFYMEMQGEVQVGIFVLHRTFFQDSPWTPTSKEKRH